MKTSLHDSMESWFATREGHIPFWKWTEDGRTLIGHTGNINFLIESANKYIGKDDFKKMSHIPYDHVFGYSLGLWMGRFVEKGFTSELLKELREELGGVRFFHTLNPAIPSRGKPLPHWEHSADMEDFNDPQTTAAYAFSQQMTVDGFAKLRRCKDKTCLKFFVGRPDAKWCSKSCGSKHRVNEKRRKDKRRKVY